VNASAEAFSGVAGVESIASETGAVGSLVETDGFEPVACSCALVCIAEVLALFGLFEEPCEDFGSFFRLSAYVLIRADLFSGSSRPPAFDPFGGFDGQVLA
jgi:hypothetical protein